MSEGIETITSFTNALKETYEDGIKDQLNRDVVLYDALQSGTKKVKLEGSDLVFSTKLGRAYGAHAIAENGKLPDAGSATRAKGRVKPKDVWGRAQLTKRLMAVSKSDRGAFADALADKMDDLQEDLKYEVARALVGNKVAANDPDGTALNLKTGILGQVKAGASGTTVTVENISSCVQLRPGMPIAIGSVADLTASTSTAVHAKIASIDNTGQITLDANSATFETGDAIVRGGANANAYDEEFTGIAHIVDDVGELYGIDPASSPQWAAFVDDNSTVSRPWSHDIMNKVFRSIKTKSGKRPDYVTGHDAQVDEIANTLVSDVRYEPCKFKGGYERSFLTWNNGERDIPIVPDDMFEPGKLVFLSMDCLAMCETVPMGFDETDSLLQRVTDRVSYEIVYGTIGNLVCYQRNAHGVLEDLQFDETNFAFAS
tara:strand:- start:60 stop:1349 length:1290 start_codon:yes stop_codon:yes gene_type:complete